MPLTLGSHWADFQLGPRTDKIPSVHQATNVEHLLCASTVPGMRDERPDKGDTVPALGEPPAHCSMIISVGPPERQKQQGTRRSVCMCGGGGRLTLRKWLVQLRGMQAQICRVGQQPETWRRVAVQGQRQFLGWISLSSGRVSLFLLKTSWLDEAHPH